MLNISDFAKRGGYYAEVDQSIFLEPKANKRIVHFRSTKFPARTLHDDDPDSMSVEDFDLQAYIETLSESSDATDTYEL